MLAGADIIISTLSLFTVTSEQCSMFDRMHRSTTSIVLGLAFNSHAVESRVSRQDGARQYRIVTSYALQYVICDAAKSNCFEMAVTVSETQASAVRCHVIGPRSLSTRLIADILDKLSLFLFLHIADCSPTRRHAALTRPSPPCHAAV